MVRQQPQPPLCAAANYGVEWYGAAAGGGSGRGAGLAARSGAPAVGLSYDGPQSAQATPKALGAMPHQQLPSSVEGWRRELAGQPRSAVPGSAGGGLSDGGGESGGGELEERMLRCCMSGDKDQWRTLLPLAASGGFQVNWRDKSGRTALSYAASSGHAEAIGKLLQCRGVDVNLADNDGNTPLIYAAAMGFDGALSMLLSFPLVNVDQANSNGCTALIRAAMSGHPSAVKMLLDAGASTSVRDRRRQLTPVEWARFCGSSTSYHLLRSCIARSSRDTDGGERDAGGLGAAPRRRGATRRSGSTRVSLLRHRSASADATRPPSPSSPPPSSGAQHGDRCKERGNGGVDALASFARRLRETLLFRSVSGRGQRASSQREREQQQQPERRLCVAAAFGQCASAPSIPLLLAAPGGGGGDGTLSSPPARGGESEPCSAQAELVKWTLRQLGCDRPFRMHILKASVPRIEITAAADDTAVAAAVAAAYGAGSAEEELHSNGIACGGGRRRGAHSPPPPMQPPAGDWRGHRRSSDPVPWRCVARGRADGGKAGIGAAASDGRADSGARGPPRRYASSPVNQMRQVTASCR